MVLLACTRHNSNILGAVDPSAHASVISTFGIKSREDEDDAEKPKKMPKLSIKDQRVNKIKDDLSVAASTIAMIDANTTPKKEYLVPIMNSLLAKVKALKQLSHDHHEAVLHGAASEDVEKFWAEISQTSRGLTADIDIARSMTQPGTFIPHTTQWDGTLV